MNERMREMEESRGKQKEYKRKKNSFLGDTAQV